MLCDRRGTAGRQLEQQALGQRQDAGLGKDPPLHRGEEGEETVAYGEVLGVPGDHPVEESPPVLAGQLQVLHPQPVDQAAALAQPPVLCLHRAVVGGGAEPIRGLAERRRSEIQRLVGELPGRGAHRVHRHPRQSSPARRAGARRRSAAGYNPRR